MKALEVYFRKLGDLPDYGIAYNIDGLQEIKYWDTEGRVSIIKGVPADLEEGIYSFKSSDGSLVLLKQSL